MGKILVKAQQQNVFNRNNSGVSEKAYILRPVRYTTMRGKDIVNSCAMNSAIPKTYLSSSMVALAQCIENFLLNGHSVEFPNLGIFSLSSRGVSEADVNKAGVTQLNKLKVRFLPCTELKANIENIELEFDGVYDIAGENVAGEKFYSKVVRKLEASDSDTPDAGGTVVIPGGGTSAGKKTLTVAASPSAGGTVTGGGQYEAGASAEISATAASGYTFLRWSDGDTNASRTVTVNDNLTLQAIFNQVTSGDGGLQA